MVYHRLKPDPSDRFRALVDEVQTFVETAGLDDLERAVGVAAEASLHDRFREEYGITAEASGRPCIARLWDRECRHDSLTSEAPHQPPHADHASLWLVDGDPAVYSVHLYDLPDEHVRDLADFADEYGLCLRIEPYSLYWPGRTTLVTFARSAYDPPD